MKVPAGAIASYLASPPPAIKAILLYGPDEGLVSLRLQMVKKAILGEKFDPLLLTEFSYPDIRENPYLLVDTLQMFCMVPGRRLVIIRDIAATLDAEIVENIANSAPDSFLLLIAGELGPSSKTRSIFEKEPYFAPIPCYKEEGAALQQWIRQQLAERGYQADSPALIWLTQRLEGNKLIALSEIEKLCLYMGDETRIDEKSVLEAIGDSTEATLDGICTSFCNREKIALQTMFERVVAEGIMPIVIIRSVLRYIMRLVEIKIALAEGKTLQQAGAALRPPLFFKAYPLIERQLRLWSDVQLFRAIRALLNLEAQIKKGAPALLLLERLLLLMAASTKR